MSALRFNLPPKAPRYFLQATFDASNPTHVQEVLLNLSKNSPASFRAAHQWYGLFQEASAAISEVHTQLELAVQLDTGDREAEEKLRLFDEHILSQMLLIRGELMDIYLSSPWKHAMHPDDRERIRQDFNFRRKFANPAISELQIAENQHVRDYRAFINNKETEFGGRNTALSVIIGKLADNNAETRKQAFLAYWGFIHSQETKLQALFQNLLQNRIQQAELLGIESYVPLAFAELGRIDYGTAECEQFRKSIATAVVPAITELSRHQIKNLGTQKLMPWDSNAWPQLMPHQNPAGGNLEKLLTGMHEIAQKIHPSFGELFQDMRARGLIDIGPRHRKSPGAFCVTFQESRMPFIFGNFAGNFRDAMTLVHEFGHSIHGYATSSISNVLLRHPGLEFCEVASMGLEMLAAKHFLAWWPNPKEARKAWAFQVFNALQFWPFMAMIDGWQHAVYSQKLTGAADRNAAWLQLSRTYKPHVDWTGYEHFEPLGWFSRPHVFTSPFYYIDYGIAQLGAVQLWQQSKHNETQAVNNYIKGLALGAQRSLPELFEAAGLKLDFSAQWLQTLVEQLTEEVRAVLEE